MNTDQANYVSGLEYEWKGSVDDLKGIQISEDVRARLAAAQTADEVVRVIKSFHCFGKKDTLIVALLGD